MDILKTALEWAKAESFSSAFFIAFGLMFLLASYGFWQMGKTDMAKAYVIPTLVAGALLLILGIGLVIPNQLRIANFPVAFENDAMSFIGAEIERVEKTLNGYKLAIYRIFPMIVAACAVLILFLNAPIWRASLVTTIAMFVIIIMVDSNAGARLETYKAKLQSAKQLL